eukprot:scaffold7005_cov28-Tisochrysis_lutea.AAC.2
MAVPGRAHASARCPTAVARRSLSAAARQSVAAQRSAAPRLQRAESPSRLPYWPWRRLVPPDHVGSTAEGKVEAYRLACEDQRGLELRAAARVQCVPYLQTSRGRRAVVGAGPGGAWERRALGAW